MLYFVNHYYEQNNFLCTMVLLAVMGWDGKAFEK